MTRHSSLPTIPFTQEAYDQMVNDLATLRAEEQAVLPRLTAAREMGDLSENGAYKYAKFELGRIRREIKRLENLIAQAKVIATPAVTGVIQFGSVVTVTDGTRELVFTMVSQYESDPLKGKISYQSPLGRALMDHRVGEKVTIETPSGSRHYTILAVN